MSNPNKKFYIILILCIVIILAFWIFSLKVNIQNSQQNKSPRSGLSFAELRKEIAEIISKSPLSKQENKPDTDELKELTDKLAEEIKNRETADWLTYQNEEYGFEFKYPEDLIIRPEDGPISFLTPEMSEKYKSKETNIVSTFWIEVLGFMGEVSLDEIGSTLLPHTKNYQKEYVTINNNSFLKVNEPGVGLGSEIYHYAKDESLIQFGKPAESNFDLEKPLSTFEFIDETINGISLTCNLNNKCTLINKDLDYRSCWPNMCENVDYSLDKYIAVNKESFEAFKESELKFRPSDEKCKPAHGCPISFSTNNDNFSAECINNICTKVFK